MTHFMSCYPATHPSGSFAPLRRTNLLITMDGMYAGNEGAIACPADWSHSQDGRVQSEINSK